MCNINLNWENLLSGLIGSIVGAGATILATKMIIKSSVESYNKQREIEKNEDFEERLTALKNEIHFNSSLHKEDVNAKIRSYSRIAWEAFLPYVHRLSSENQSKHFSFNPIAKLWSMIKPVSLMILGVR